MHSDPTQYGDAQEAARDALVALMAGLSEEYWCAGWLVGLEYSLWSIVVRDLNPKFGVGRLTERQILLLHHLAEESGVWWQWSPDGTGPVSIPLDEWRTLYSSRAVPL